MITHDEAIARSPLRTSPAPRRRAAGLMLAAVSTVACLSIAVPAAQAAALPMAASGAPVSTDGSIVKVSGGRKAAWIIGGIAALGAGAAIAAQNRRADPGYGYDAGAYGYGGYAPAPVYAPPPPVYAPAPVYVDPYAEDEGYDYAPPPPPPVYPRARRAYYDYGYGYGDREPSVSVDYYGRRTRLLPEGK